ncbi:hypothetical protein [Novosphingobium panipatense]|uniref:hypothetical protein n=1 Tax=Novosphingobium panipatense TaxID=428991 RepID=UPI0036212813
MRANYQLNMRYPGQNFSLSFDFAADAPLGDLSFIQKDFAERAVALFNARHMAEYAHVREHEVPEISGVRLAAHVVTPHPRHPAASCRAALRLFRPRNGAPTSGGSVRCRSISAATLLRGWR